MEKIIIVRYGEMMLKGKNLKDFKQRLRHHINTSFKNLNITYEQRHEFLLITNYPLSLENIIIDKLNHIPGLHSFSIGLICANNDEELLKAMLSFFTKYDFSKTIKITTKRSDKTLPYTSQTFSLRMANLLLPHLPQLKVNLKNPQELLYLQLLPNNKVLVFLQKHHLLGGMPTNTQGQILHLLSGGIDSPVAAIELIRNGVNLNLIHFESSPLTPLEGLDKVFRLGEEIAKYTPNEAINLYVVPFSELHQALIKFIDDSYLINLMRRMMYRIATKVANNLKINLLSTGDSIGQVASQTLESIVSIDNVSNKSIIRPLATFDKESIIILSQKYHTYDISIIPFSDCCTAYLPKRPITKPKIKKAEYWETLIPYEDLINKIMPKIKLIKLSPHKPYRLKDKGLAFEDAYQNA